MKIALISTLLGQQGYGAEISSLLLAQILHTHQEEVIAISCKSDPQLPFRSYSLPLLNRLPNLLLLIGHPFIDYYAQRKIENILRQEKPDLIHLQDYSLLIPTIKAARKTKIPTVMTVRSYQFMCNLSTCLEENKLNFNCSRSRYRRCLKRSLRESRPKLRFLWPLLEPWFYFQNQRIKKYFKKVNRYITVSDFVKKQLLVSGSVHPETVRTIKVSKGDWQPLPTKPNRQPLIFAQGGLKKSKGFHYLIKSFRQVVDKHPQAQLRIAGEGAARKRLEDLTARLNLKKNVTFLGKVNYAQQRREFAQADFVVSPSLWPEPLSRGLFETFAMKKTTIATKVGGSPELVKHNVTGILVEPNDLDQLAKAMITLIEKPKWRAQLAQRAYRLINQECDPHRLYQQHLQVYHETLRKR